MIERINNTIILILKYLVTLSISLMVIITFANIITRNLFQFGILWAEEISRDLFVWSIFLGVTICVLDSSLMSINLFTAFMEKRNLKMACKIIYWFSCLIFFGIIAYYGTLYAIAGHSAKSSMLGIHLSVIYASIPFCGYVSVIFILLDIIKFIQKK